MDSKAMTLVEMLIAVSIFVFIVTGTYLLFRGFNKVFKRGEIESSYRQDVRIVAEIFARDISSMCVNAEGTKGALAFFANIKNGRMGSVCEVHYKIDKGLLKRAVELDSDRNLATCAGEYEGLISGVEQGEFSYKNDSWSDFTTGLPNAVKLRVEWKSYGREYEKEFIANVMSGK